VGNAPDKAPGLAPAQIVVGADPEIVLPIIMGFIVTITLSLWVVQGAVGAFAVRISHTKPFVLSFAPGV
jgi:hypothetical protein